VRSAAAAFHPGTRFAYRMHGVNVAIESDQPTLVSDLQRRLAPFSSLTTQGLGTELRFEFRTTGLGVAIELRPVLQRMVYEVAGIQFQYDDTHDHLFVSRGKRVIGMCDAGRGAAVFDVRTDEGTVDELYSQTLFTVCLVELMKRHGRFSLHAAGISVGNAGIIFAGPSGAGKSTLAIVMLQTLTRRAGFLGDDMLFLTAGADEIRMLGWPEPIHVGEWTQRALPALASRMQVPASSGRKGRIAGSEVAGAMPALDATPEVMIFPRVTARGRSTLIPLSPDEALLELAPNVLLTEATSSQAHLSVLGSLARQCRCYRLEVGTDIEALPGLLLELI
jgi:hypothetical protein